jgi:hypothetical protein
MPLQPHLEFPGYAQDAWVRVSGHQDRPWLELVSVWEACNRQVAAVLRHVDPSTLRNTWTDPEGRRVDLEFVARDYVVHLRHHLEQITLR